MKQVVRSWRNWRLARLYAQRSPLVDASFMRAMTYREIGRLRLVEAKIYLLEIEHAGFADNIDVESDNARQAWNKRSFETEVLS